MNETNTQEHKQKPEQAADEANLGNQEEDVRQGRKSLTMPVSKAGKNKVRYVEGTKKLKDGCWLSDN